LVGLALDAVMLLTIINLYLEVKQEIGKQLAEVSVAV
jgi:hypothetical protein